MAATVDSRGGEVWVGTDAGIVIPRNALDNDAEVTVRRASLTGDDGFWPWRRACSRQVGIMLAVAVVLAVVVFWVGQGLPQTGWGAPWPDLLFVLAVAGLARWLFREQYPVVDGGHFISVGPRDWLPN